jgi:hypothetical protein
MNTLFKLLATGTLTIVFFTSFTANVQAVAGQWSASSSLIYYTDGAVSIGASSTDQSYKLNITGTTDPAQKVSHLRLNHTANRFWTFKTLQYGRADYGSYGLEINQPADTYSGCAGCGGDLVLSPYQQVIMRSSNTATGNRVKVGINTDNPTKELSVNGTIVAKEVIVSTQSQYWPDYVFSDDYSLMSLEEIESYIQKNNHLPNIPSQFDIEKQGLSLGEMQRLHMEKIEELTLHLIEKDKEIDSLEDRISKLESLFNN